MTNPILVAIPIFFVLIGLELLASRWVGRQVYRFNDSIADIGTGMFQLIIGLFSKGLVVGVYILLYESARLTEWPVDDWRVWVVGFLAVDALYYAFHRWSHESNAPWATHVVHHQSEEYNLSVALRQGAFQAWFSFPFYLPLALLGLHWKVFLALKSINTLYQFWIHTRLIGRLGPLEWIFNTPSHHRVHHARNPQYLDRNYAGTLIIWDRLFGTFEPEVEEPVYGITKPLRSWNPLWANFAEWARLRELFLSARTWRDRLLVFIKGPAWTPEGVTPPASLDLAAPKWDPPTPGLVQLYVLVHFAIAVVLDWLLLYSEALWDVSSLAILGAFVAFSLLCFSGLAEGRRWAPLTELLRILTAPAGAALLLSGTEHAGLAALLAAIATPVFVLCLVGLMVKARRHFIPRSELPPALFSALRDDSAEPV